MTKIFLVLAVLLGLSSSFGLGAAAAEPQVPILCYHSAEVTGDAYNVSPDKLRSHFAYLRRSGYEPISLEHYAAAVRGEAKLPAKPIILSFDDGYTSFYTQIYPLLKEFNYPAVMAIITSWPDNNPDAVTWAQLREMDSSGLISIASHTDKLHQYAATNAFGDSWPLTEVPPYVNGQYESAAAYAERIADDLRASKRKLEAELGHAVQTLAWPYGAYTGENIKIAADCGFSVGLLLEDTPNGVAGQDMQQLRRIIVTDNPDAEQLGELLAQAAQNEQTPLRIMQMDLDAVYDADTEQLERNLDRFIARLQASNANTVYLQAFNDSQGNGNIESVYFATANAPVKGDIFSHAVARIKAAGRYKVYAWLPTLSAQWLTNDFRGADKIETIKAWQPENGGWYNRATPFDKRTAAALRSAYADLALRNAIDGVLFQDDLYMNDFEDYSRAAGREFRRATGSLLTAKSAGTPDAPFFQQWTELKTDALTKLTQELAQEVRRYRPQAKMARNLYAILVLQPWSQEWLAENYGQYLDVYDYVVVMAYPYMENPDFDGDAEQALSWQQELAAAAIRDLSAEQRSKLVFKLQTYDWAHNRHVTADDLIDQSLLMRQAGISNLAYYPEIDFAIPN